MYLWLSCNSRCRPGWPQIHRNLSASASKALGLNCIPQCSNLISNTASIESYNSQCFLEMPRFWVSRHMKFKTLITRVWEGGTVVKSTYSCCCCRGPGFSSQKSNWAVKQLPVNSNSVRFDTSSSFQRLHTSAHTPTNKNKSLWNYDNCITFRKHSAIYTFIPPLS